jgi:hypothetical protein
MICTENLTIDSSAGPVVLHDLANDAYHKEEFHISRSKAHRYRGGSGGVAQRFEDEGGQVFAGNASTSFGSLVDAMFEAVCRGDFVQSVVAVAPPDVLTANGQRRGKRYTEWRSALPADVIETKEEDFEKASAVIAAIREHKSANELILQTTQTQESVFWVDDDGHKRKARCDGRAGDRHWYDLKTTSKELSQYELSKSFHRFGYAWQAAWYAEAAGLAGCDEPGRFPFIVAASYAPYEVCVVTLSQESVDYARDEIKKTLDMISRRRESGEYLPESYHNPISLDLSKWFS